MGLRSSLYSHWASWLVASIVETPVFIVRGGGGKCISWTEG